MLDSSKYRETMEALPRIASKAEFGQKPRPWWRFW
jgi:hypothetical protein